MKNQHELSRCMKTLAQNYDAKKGKGAFKKLDDEALETLCCVVGTWTEGEPSVAVWDAACAAFFNS